MTTNQTVRDALEAVLVKYNLHHLTHLVNCLTDAALAAQRDAGEDEGAEEGKA